MILFVIWLFAFMIFAWIYIFCKLSKFALSNLYQGSIELYRYFKVTKPMVESGFIEKKQMEERMVIEEKVQRNEQYIKEKQDKTIRAGINKVQELRIKYPSADENLFSLYLQKYPYYLLHELQEIEDRIYSSHLMNVR